MENPTGEETISEEDARQELARVLRSQQFVASDRLCEFLRFVVDRAFDGTADQLKESWIAAKVYGRGADYDPSQDSIVRTEARRLRNKLKEYYETGGKADPVAIYFRLGRYIPLFRRQEGSNGTPRPAADSSLPEPPGSGQGVSVAVIPFVDLSGQTLSAECARNLTDELTHGFMHTEGVRVASARSVLLAAEQTKDVPSLARTLGVQIIFEGTVRQEGSRLRVIANVVSAEGFQLWSQRFEASADSEGLFLLTERLASALISRTRPELSTIRKRNDPVSPAVLSVIPSLYGAEALLDTGTAAALQAALVKFGAVIERVPDFARPFCGVAQCHYLAAMHGAPGPAALISRACEAAARALELDPEMILSQMSMGAVQALDWEWDEAERSFQRALGLGDHAAAHRQYALFLTASERFDRAAYHLQRAQQIDPFSGAQKLTNAMFCHFTRQSEERLRDFIGQAAFGPLPASANLYVALVHLQSGDGHAAQRLVQESRVEAGAQPTLMAFVAEIMARCGDIEQAARIVQQGQLLSQAPPISGYRQALLSLALGKTGDALACLSKAHAQKEPELVWLAVEPRFDPVRDEKDFTRLLRELPFGSIT